MNNKFHKLRVCEIFLSYRCFFFFELCQNMKYVSFCMDTVYIAGSGTSMVGDGSASYLLVSYSFSYTSSDVCFVVRQASGQINHYSQNVGHNLRSRFVICREIAQLTGDSPRRIQSDRTSCVVGSVTAGRQMPSRPLSVCPSQLVADRSIAGHRQAARKRDHRIIANA